MKFQVAIIGSPGSGKTVLTAVLSRYLSSHSDKVYMNPKAGDKCEGKDFKTIPTISYINETLDVLYRGEWATSGTVQGTSYDLGYELHIGKNVYEMKLLDSPGEDLQRIWMSYDRTALSAFQQGLCNYILSSNAVVLVVNLDHFADAPTLTVKSENENVLKEAVDNLVKAGVCHHILVCFTAYDKYKAYIDHTYAGNFIQYLESELPMFHRSFGVAGKTVVRDYTEYGKGQKMVRLKCIAVAPVIAQQPTPEVNPDRFWKPPVGFGVQNSQHSQGIPQIENWLCECEQSERYWDEIECDIARSKKWLEFLSNIAPTIIGACCGFFVWLLFWDLFVGIRITFVMLLLSSVFLGAPIGAIVGFKAGVNLFVKNQTKVLINALMTKKMDSLIKKMDSFIGKVAMKKGEKQETAVPCETSTALPRPSGTRGTAATSGSEAGSENFD